MAFDRVKALDYARKHWTIPCDDGIYWLTNERISIEQKRKELKAPAADGWVPMFVRYTDPDGKAEKAIFKNGAAEKLISDWDGLADCAHFLSKCLQAGGAKLDERGVHSLVVALQARADTKTLGDKVTQDGGQRIIDSGILKDGDMIGYFNVKPDGDYGEIRYTHSTMYGGKLNAADPGRVTCHTMCRFPGLSDVEDRWYLKSGNYKYTFIHFTAGDTAVAPGAAKALSGWWKGVFGGDIYYYYILADGRARWTRVAPKNSAATLSQYGAAGTAYWFEKSGSFVMIWQKSGGVETWTANPGGGGFKIVWGAQTGSATKMF